MSFNQKCLAAITVLLLGITAAITFVCYEPPYSGNFWISYGVLSFSELIFGAFWIQQIGKRDSVMPISIGVWGLNAVYFLFALIATLFTHLEDKNFILVQTVGFSVFVVMHLLFRMMEHHIEEQAKEDMPEQKIERANVTWR